MNTGQESEETLQPRCGVPPRQRPYEAAVSMGFDALTARELTASTIDALGVERLGDLIRIAVLHRHLLADPANRTVCVEGGGPARASWAVLAVHYLVAEDTTPDPREVTLAHFPECRGYLAVFEKRIIGRFLATSGSTAQGFEEASERLRAEKVAGTGLAYRFHVMPRVPITIIRYEGDDELGPGASVVYRADAERLLPAEDCIVAAELVLDALAGKPIDVRPGGVS